MSFLYSGLDHFLEKFRAGPKRGYHHARNNEGNRQTRIDVDERLAYSPDVDDSAHRKAIRLIDECGPESYCR